MKLIPQPQNMTLGDGFFRLKYNDRITLHTSCPASAYDTAKLLAGEVEAQTGIPKMIDRRAATPHRGIHLSLSGTAQKEAYRLEITPDGIWVTASDESGLLCSVQTLRQILRQQGGLLPCLSISDYPALPVRGLFYDATRCRIPTMEFMKSLADLCSFYKLNQLHLYIEHTYLFDGFSEVWRDDTPLTAQDILELDAYCRKLHIDLVPSVATLGHLYKVLRTRTYRHLSEIEDSDDVAFSFYERMCHHTLDVTQEGSLELVYQMLDEYASLFTSDLFNINGDEPFDLGRGRGKKLADEIGSHQMYVDWLAKVCRHVQELGKRPMFWGDVILADPETIKELPAEIICMNWDYDTAPRENHAKSLAATGVAQYLCPGAQGWKQTINQFETAYLNIRKMATLAHKYNGAGLLVTEWGDFGHLQDPESSLPGIIYSAAMGWNTQFPTEEALNEAISVLEYGDPSGKIMSVLRTLSQQVVMNWGHVVEFVEIQQGHIEGRTMERFRADFQSWINDRLEKAEEMQQTIDVCLDQIAALTPTMTGRKRMYSYVLMAEGQKLLNHFAMNLYGENTKDPQLAADLEAWWNSYKNLWRKSSRESELYRNGEVIFYLADYLRQNR